MKPRLLDLFAGPGGWDVGARALGFGPLGIEIDDAACATREAASHPTLQGDVAALDPDDFGPVDLLIASPPCQAWSMAGKREGEKDKAQVYELTTEIAKGFGTPHEWDPPFDWADPRSALVTEPLRWALALRPRFLAFEQVPPVLGYWKHLASILRGEGYGVWAGILSAEQYGVPQTRKRAILMAELDGNPHPPIPTHQRHIPGEPQWSEPKGNLLGTLLPWVSMGEALGWSGVDVPAPTVTAGGTSAGGVEVFARGGRERIGRVLRSHQSVDGVDRAYRNSDEPAVTICGGSKSATWVDDRPATTINTTNGVSEPGHHGEKSMSHNAVRVTVEQAATLQGFPADYPWQGTRTKRFEQVGNAVPPPLAEAILGALLAELNTLELAA